MTCIGTTGAGVETGDMPGNIFTDWTAQDRELWGHVPQTMGHTLHTNPLFTREALAELISSYPRANYSLIHMGAQGSRRFWREGDIGGLSGAQVIDWIAAGRLWINLREVNKVDARYASLLDQAYDEIARNTRTRETFNRNMGILISSPGAQVYYHADLFGQALWQVAGKKRVYVYPNHDPFLPLDQLEDIAAFGVEVDLQFKDYFEPFARCLTLEPGQMAHWPLNGPHRVENLDMLNVSVTTEHMTPWILRRHRSLLANALLRHRYGVRFRGLPVAGPGYWARTVAQAVLRRGAWLAERRAAKRPIEFSLDPATPGAVLDRDAPAGIDPRRSAA
jgi:hypothetical protein